MLNPGPVLLRGRAAAESLMVDACTIRRRTGESTDDDTGFVTPTYTTVYTGRCKVQQQSASASPSDVGQDNVLIGQLELHLPAATTGPQPDDQATITASVNDADLVGRTFKLRGRPHKSFLTARRFPLIEVTS